MNSNLRAKARGKGLAIRIEMANSEPWYRAVISDKKTGRWLRLDADDNDLIASVIENFDDMYQHIVNGDGIV